MTIITELASEFELSATAVAGLTSILADPAKRDAVITLVDEPELLEIVWSGRMEGLPVVTFSTLQVEEVQAVGEITNDPEGLEALIEAINAASMSGPSAA